MRLATAMPRHADASSLAVADLLLDEEQLLVGRIQPPTALRCFSFDAARSAVSFGCWMRRMGEQELDGFPPKAPQLGRGGSQQARQKLRVAGASLFDASTDFFAEFVEFHGTSLRLLGAPAPASARRRTEVRARASPERLAAAVAHALVLTERGHRRAALGGWRAM
jgi:hypothetical protein